MRARLLGFHLASVLQAFDLSGLTRHGRRRPAHKVMSPLIAQHLPPKQELKLATAFS